MGQKARQNLSGESEVVQVWRKYRPKLAQVIHEKEQVNGYTPVDLLFYVVGRQGFEPWTLRLKVLFTFGHGVTPSQIIQTFMQV